jgi:Arc/MetJ-type ribon-helix-helix transcriptional regulator
MRQPKVTIKIPKPLYEHIKRLIQETGFNSVTDYVVYILRDLVYEGQKGDPQEMTPYELRRIKDKLKTLGYL